MSGADRPWEAGDEPTRWAGYFDPATGLLRNLSSPPAQTATQLQQFEDAHVERRIFRLRVEPIAGGYDLEHVQAIHRELFRDVFPWAGELRTVGISKGTRDLPDGTQAKAGFLPVEHIPFVVNGMADQLRQENYLRGLSNEEFGDRLAAHFNDLNEAHPFRDGNGRTQRALWDQLAAEAGHTIHWQAVPNEVNIRISHEARVNNNLEPLRSTLRAIVTDDGLMARTVKSHEASRLAAMDAPTRPGAGLAGNATNPAPSPGYRPPGLDAGRGYGR